MAKQSIKAPSWGIKVSHPREAVQEVVDDSDVKKKKRHIVQDGAYTELRTRRTHSIAVVDTICAETQLN
jgi:hypothetical protein